MTKKHAPIRPEIAEPMRAVGRMVTEILPDSHGFILIVCDVGEGGHTSYVSSIRREDAIRVLREMVSEMEAVTN